METSIDRGIDSVVKRLRFTTAERHVGNGTLVLGLARGSHLRGSSRHLGSSCFSGPTFNQHRSQREMRSSHNASDDITHAPTSIATQHLDCDEIARLGNAILAASDRSRTMGAVPVPILVHIVLRDGLAPFRSPLKFDVADVDAGIDDIRSNAIASRLVVQVFGEGGEVQRGSVRQTSETPRCSRFSRDARRRGLVNTQGHILGLDNLVPLDISDFRS